MAPSQRGAPAGNLSARAHLLDIGWCLLIPFVVIAVYLVIGVGVVSMIGEPILGTAVLGGIVVLAVLVVRQLRPGWLAYAPGPRPKDETPRFRRIVLGCVVLAFLAGQSLALWLYSVVGSTGFDQSTEVRQDAGVVLTLILALIAAPLGEEALFRGTIYPLLRRRVGMIASVLVSAAVFALMHGNAVQFASALPLAVLMGLVYERTRTLWPCMLIHLGFNLAATFTPPILLMPLANPVSALLLLAAFLGCALMIYQRIVGQAPADQPGGPGSEGMQDESRAT